MKESPLPRYVKCIEAWTGSLGDSLVGKVYDTEYSPDFSIHSWKDILRVAPSKFINCDKCGNTLDENDQPINEQFKFLM